MAKVRSPRPIRVDSGKRPSMGPSLDSGFRSRKNAYSPASGVRSARDGELLTPTRREVPPARVEFESDIDLEPARTRLELPDPSLLALARGDADRSREEGGSGPDAPPARADRPSRMRFFWFVLGITVGAGIAWAVASNDLSPEIYRARVWVAGTLRSIRGKAEPEAPPAPVKAVSTPAPAAIPTVDVTQLPKAREEQAPAPVSTVPTLAAPSPGAPALTHAPGPR